MKLITEELIARFKEVGDQSEMENPIIIAKFFDPVGSATWYATEYDAETNVCFGYVTGLAYDEWGTFSITEMEAIQRPFGLSIERDIYFKEIPFSDLTQKSRMAELKKNKDEKQRDELER
ncbi:single-stranded DNA endonuclease [Dokdonia pacifica]|uniref:DUF2958 domain-containing protein n=1 Tax=Dokdonia pacifica TaxID=1627892 RepID=A0A239E668_9FLAO|nr:DUF2958 domain-containing protein [Dokdonia pacifica]GGG25073.1 single-stranded DNA endonuclease [Dokdonia pacifica]SNS40205.1 Protein of unknown function [Dokdonia pacifica]